MYDVAPPFCGHGKQLIYFQGKMKFGKLKLSSISQQIPAKLGKRMSHRMREKMIKKNDPDEMQAGTDDSQFNFSQGT